MVDVPSRRWEVGGSSSGFTKLGVGGDGEGKSGNSDG